MERLRLLSAGRTGRSGLSGKARIETAVDVPWYLYVGFIAFVLAMLLVDLKFFDAHNEETRTRQAAMWVTAWVSMAIGFGVIVFFWHGGQKAAEYFAGYLIE